MSYQDLIKAVIDQAVKACMEKNACKFAALFSERGEIILNKNYHIAKADIETVTQNYFASLEYIKILVTGMIIEDNRACLEWTWEDYNRQTNQNKCQDNAIVIKFESDLIVSWREYKG